MTGDTGELPGAVEPEAIEPEAVEPEAVEPEAIDTEAVKPEAVEPEAADTEAVELRVVVGPAGVVGRVTTVVEATTLVVQRLVELRLETVLTEVAKMVEVVSLCEVLLADLRELEVVVLQGTSGKTQVLVAGTV